MAAPTSVPRPQARPSDLTIERQMTATPAVLYRAWTEGFDRWFAAPGTLTVSARVGGTYHFEVEAAGQRHPHGGRFLRLEPDHLVELTWVTGAGGTEGVETVVTVELTPDGSGTRLRLTHAGFASEAARDGHERAWPMVLAQLDEQMAAERCDGPSSAGASGDVAGPVMRLEREPVVETGMLIRRPVAEVFEAFADPAITSRFWFTHGSGRLESGARVRWEWAMYGADADVSVREVEPNARILVEWGSAGEPTTTVEWTFAPHGDGATFVSVTNSGFAGDGDGVVAQAIDAVGGFGLVLAGAKAWLEHGIELNLIADRYPAGTAGIAITGEGSAS